MGTLRKILTTGVGAALMTEESLRNALADIQVTRQAKDYLARQAQKGRDEFTKVLVGEFKKFLMHVSLQEEIQKALGGISLHIDARIRIESTDHEARKRTLRRIHLKMSPSKKTHSK